MADLDKQRAANALDMVRILQKKGEKEYGNYVSFVKALPAVILQTGLGQALASELASAGTDNDTQNGHRCLFHDVSQWLGRDDAMAPFCNQYSKETGILDALLNGNESTYLQAQYEALAYVSWLKKFAVALLIQPKGEGS